MASSPSRKRLRHTCVCRAGVLAKETCDPLSTALRMQESEVPRAAAHLTLMAELRALPIGERCLRAALPTSSPHLRAAVLSTLPSMKHARLFLALAKRGLHVERLCALLVDSGSVLGGGLVARAVGPWHTRTSEAADSNPSDVDIFTSFAAHEALVARLQTELGLQIFLRADVKLQKERFRRVQASGRGFRHECPLVYDRASEVGATRAVSLTSTATLMVPAADIALKCGHEFVDSVHCPAMHDALESTAVVPVPAAFHHEFVPTRLKVDVVFPAFNHTTGAPSLFQSHYGFLPCTSGLDIVNQSFDFGCCVAAFDGQRFFCSLEADLGLLCERAAITGAPAYTTEAATRARLVDRRRKYAQRGYVPVALARKPLVIAQSVSRCLPALPLECVRRVLEFCDSAALA